MTMQSVTSPTPARAPATDPGAISALVRDVRETFDSGRTRPLAWRVKQLENLIRFTKECDREIYEALRLDLGKPQLEAHTTEVNFVRAEADYTLKHLAEWMRPERVSTPLVTQPGKGFIYKDPLGVVLIIAPWNYPFQLCVGPLVGALAAGNAAVLKPSEVAPHTSALIAKRIPQYFDPSAVKVVEGGVAETTALLEERWDHIFYTGNGSVGRIVMAAAAKHLTPVTLELGGKSPTYVDASADLDVAARRICWGKFSNAGQTCVAPDYILAHAAIHDGLIQRLRSTIRDFYGADPKQSGDFGRIINERHHRRVMKLVGSGEVVVGGEGDESTRYIAPTVLKDVSPESPVMQEEIFGPVLPVLKVSGVDEAIRFINGRDKPLALYVFTGDDSIAEDVLERTSAGGVTVNHTLLHLGAPELPFGGVGESGMGAYHGKSSFDLFSHKKSVLKKPTFLDPSLMYPPYTESKKKWLNRLV
jgi:aldehyde dehydrogenase (NAD+)